MQQRLHIVSFNVPYPANYGGVVDVFHRLRNLSAQGIKVHLHCYTYGRAAAPELERYCERVSYYRRDMSVLRLIDREPFIVSSRRNKQLLNNLNTDDTPILLEGLHCCALLDFIDGKRCYVRAHNVEHEYYGHLAEAEGNPLRRLYLRSDARKLYRYEPQLLKAAGVFAVTDADANHFRKIGCPHVWLMPSSHADDTIRSHEGIGSYALYHGDLSVAENIQAAQYLMNHVFADQHHKLIITGRNPAKTLTEQAAKMEHVQLIANPGDDEMLRLMSEAQVHILITNQPTGLKLKLLNSLYRGRHLLVNSHMVAGTGLGEVCTVANNAEAQRAALNRLMATPFETQDIIRRQNHIGTLYSNEANAKRMIEAIYGQE